MPLFFYAWKSQECPSLLVEERDEGRARVIATRHHETPPDAVRELAPGFTAEVLFWDNDDLDDDELEDLSEEDVEAGDHIGVEVVDDQGLRLLENETAKAIESRHIRVTLPRCTDENEAETGVIVRCELEKHSADVAHEGGGFTW